MSNNKLAKLLTDTLPSGLPNLFNPWRERCTDDQPCNGPDAKLARLAAHLTCDPKFILCGEAAGYQGCRHSGIAFTSERLLREGRIPRISPMSHRLTSRALPYSEPSATIVWGALYNLGIEERTILWNTLPMHPYKSRDEQSNRTPTSEEFEHWQTCPTDARQGIPFSESCCRRQEGGKIAQLDRHSRSVCAPSRQRGRDQICTRAGTPC